jgi:hypothetical protein
VGAQRPVWHGNAPKKTGARSARARTRGQNPLVQNIVIGRQANSKSQIRKFHFRKFANFLGVPAANRKSPCFHNNPQIANPQMSTKYRTTLSQSSHKCRPLKTILLFVLI